MNYRVTLGGTVLSTNEQPADLNSLQSSFKRDFKAGGVFFSFSGPPDNVIKLRFPGQGRTILRDAYAADGVDARVTLVIERRSSDLDDYAIVYTGLTNMATKKLTQDFFEVEFEEVSLLNQIKTNLETVVDLSSTKDVNGDSVPALSYDVMTFPDFNLVTSGTNAGIALFIYTGGSGSFATIPDFTLASNQVTYVDGSSPFESIGSNTSSTTCDYAGAIVLKPNQGREYTATVSVRATLDLIVSLFTGPITGSITLALRRENLKTGINSTVDSLVIDPSLGTQTGISLNLEETISGGSDEYRYTFRVQSTVSAHPDDDIDLFPQVGVLTLAMETTFGAETSPAKCLKLFDAITRNLKLVTGEDDLLVSTELDSAGALENIAETNGYQLRQTDRGIKGTLKQRFHMLRSVFGLGWGMEVGYLGAALNAVRVRPWNDFFADVELFELSDIETESYEESYPEELKFSRVAVGYKAYSNDDESERVDSINDFNTEAAYKIPVENIAGDLDFITDYIASGRLIEITRRKQYRAFEDKSWKHDEDLFLLDCITYLGLSPRLDANILTEDAGVILYNLLINPRFNFYNQAQLVNSVLFGKPGTTEYFNENFAVNTEGKIAYSNTFGSPYLGDTRQFAAVGSAPANNDSPQANNYRSGTAKFDPYKIKFRTALTTLQEHEMLMAHRNGLSSRNYGYITITNPDGIVRRGWLISAVFNVVDGIYEIELISRAS
jgi:hypothetical protein